MSIRLYFEFPQIVALALQLDHAYCFGGYNCYTFCNWYSSMTA